MTLDISPDVAQQIDALLATGGYLDESDVLRTALRLLERRSVQLARFRSEIAPAIESLDRGEGEPLDIEDIKARGRQRLADADRQSHGTSIGQLDLGRRCRQ